MTDAEIVLLIVIIGIIIYVYKFNVKTNETFINTQNFPYTNKYGIANLMQYGEKTNPSMYSEKMPDVYGASYDAGVNQNSKSDVYDVNGYKWTKYPKKDPNIDIITSQMPNDVLRKEYERMYMLDPSGNVAKYDVSNMKISKSCCPSQYAPPFDIGDGNNCDYANKYVANNITGMDYSNEGTIGCVCMSKDSAAFYGSRGNNI